MPDSKKYPVKEHFFWDSCGLFIDEVFFTKVCLFSLPREKRRDKTMEKRREDDSLFPILSYREAIVAAIRSNPVVIVAGETGCGKTTQLPILCFEAMGENTGKIAVTQPRRIAALSLSRYVQSITSRGTPAAKVGYKIRFSATVTAETDIIFMTDGILLAEIAADTLLRRYGTIVIDEAHERTLNIDFLLGYLRTVLPLRPDLRLVIASATLDTKLFSRCFNNAPVIQVCGRLYPIEIRYEPVIGLWKGRALRPYVDGVVHAVQSIVHDEESGDILAFLPTVDDILECRTAIQALLAQKKCDVFTLFGRMDPKGQMAIFLPTARRKIVLATNIAETSITVPNIRFVIDTGVVRRLRFDVNAGINRMPIEAISQAGANQRAGRCGRVCNGVCIRLYSQADFAGRPRFTQPEIRRSNLAGVLLRMAALGLGSAGRFPFLLHPSPPAVAAGYRHLRFLEAIDSKGKLTALGGAMAKLPLDPAIARMTLHARENGAFQEAAVIAAALSVGELWSGQSAFTGFKTENKKGEPTSDFAALLECWRRLPFNKKGRGSGRRFEAFCLRHGLNTQRVREWENIHRHVLRIFGAQAAGRDGPAPSIETVHKSLLCAFAGSLAHIQENGFYRTANMHDVAVSPGSRLHGKRKQWVLFHDIAETKRPYGRYAAEVSPHWVEELFAQQCRISYEDVRFDAVYGNVMCLRQVTFNGLPIVKDQPMDYGAASPDEASRVFVDEALVNEQAGIDFEFIRHNRMVRDSVECVQRKLRTRLLYRGDRALAEFYGQRLPGVNSIAQLHRCIGREKNDRFLWVCAADLTDGPLPDCREDFPDSLSVAGRDLPVSYAFEPGAQSDGATVRVAADVYDSTPLYFWEWLLPVFRRRRIEAALHGQAGAMAPEALEKGIEEIVGCLRPEQGHFIDQAAVLTARVFGPDAADWSLTPMHLWLRIEITDDRGETQDAFRPPRPAPRPPLFIKGKRPRLWSRWCEAWETDGCANWNGLSLLKEVFIQSTNQLAPIRGITAFFCENGSTCVRVFFSEGAAFKSHRAAVRALLERELNDKIAWAWHDFITHQGVPFRLTEQLAALGYGGIIETLFAETVLELDYTLPRNEYEFEKIRKTAEDRLAAAGPRAVSVLTEIAPEYATCLALLEKLQRSTSLTPAGRAAVSGLDGQLKGYMEMVTKPTNPLARIRAVSHYLKAFVYRARMAAEKPLRYGEHKIALEEFTAALQRGRASVEAVRPDYARMLDVFEETIEEYSVVLFTEGKMTPRFPVSRELLLQNLEALRGLKAGL